MHFHSLEALGKELVSEMRAGKTSFVQLPKYVNAQYWQEQVVVACERELRLSGESANFMLQVIDSDDESPLSVFPELGESSEETIRRFMTEYGYDPIALILNAPLTSLPSWVEFLGHVTREQKSLDHNDISRLILVLLGSETLPEGFSSASIAAYQYWNSIRWEELRLAAHEWLGRDTNEASQAWMVATYVGASNHDPLCLESLCIAKPRTIRDVAVISDEHVSMAPVVSFASTDGVLSLRDIPWKRPLQCDLQWREEGLVGATLDRGGIHSIRFQDSQKRMAALRRSIWKEQSTGLLPLIIEITYRTNRALDNAVDGDWRSRFARSYACSIDESYFREPTEIIDFFRSQPRLWVPDTTFSLLRELRSARNKLAHLVPIELTSLNTIWDMYVRTQQM